MSLEEGCRNAVETCMGISEGERVVIVSDSESLAIGKKLKEIALEITPHVRFFNLGIYGDRPLDDLPERIEEPVHDADACLWTARSVKGELETVRIPFMKEAMVQGRLGHMVDVTEEIVEKGLTGDYEVIEDFTDSIRSMALSTDEISIKSEEGTDLTAQVGKYKWVSETGMIRSSGSWENLPSGEIFTTPHSMEGTAVVTGTLGDYFHEIYDLSEIEESPVEMKIEDRKKPTVTEINCDDEDILEDLQDYVFQQECSSFVGELGIGTNIHLDELMGTMVIDEKFPNVHIALGDPNAGMTFAGWSCSTHLDLILKNCDLWFDEKKIMECGGFVEEIKEKAGLED